MIWDVDWTTVSMHSSRPDLTIRVLRAWDAHLAHRSLPRRLAPALRKVGFDDVRAEGHTFATIEFTPEAYGASAVPLIAEFVAGRDGISGEEAELWAADQRDLGDRGEFFFACIQFWLTGRSRPPDSRCPECESGGRD